MAAAGQGVHEVGGEGLQRGQDHAASAHAVEGDDAVGAGESEFLVVVRKATSGDHVAGGIHRFRRQGDVGVTGIAVARGQQATCPANVGLVQHAFVGGVAGEDEVAEGLGPFDLVRSLVDDDERRFSFA